MPSWSAISVHYPIQYYILHYNIHIDYAILYIMRRPMPSWSAIQMGSCVGSGWPKAKWGLNVTIWEVTMITIITKIIIMLIIIIILSLSIIYICIYIYVIYVYIYIYIYTHIHTYIHVSIVVQIRRSGGRTRSPGRRGQCPCGQFSKSSPDGFGSWILGMQSGYSQFSKVQSGKLGLSPGRFELSKGMLKRT